MKSKLIQPKDVTIGEITLQEVLNSHKLWMENKGGERANLRDANLRGANLADVSLTDVDLKGADLTNADLTDADLRGANLTDSDLKYANLKGVNLDFSSMPLWCGDLKANYDDKQIIQQLYHVMSHIKHSKNASDEIKKLLDNKELVEFANQFHRVDECGEI